MAEKATKELERIYTIPLRDVKSSPRNHRTDRAVRAVKAYLQRHMKAENVWIDTAVNEKIWERGMYKLVSKIRVRALKFDDGVVEVTLPETDITTSRRAEIAEKREAKQKAEETKEEKDEKKEEAGAKPEGEKPAEAKKEPAEKKAEAPQGEKKPAPKATEAGAPVRAESKEGPAKAGKGPTAKSSPAKETPKGPQKKE